MSIPRPADILLRCGGRTWQRYGVPFIRVAMPSMGGEQNTPTFTRADAATSATYIGSDGLIRTAAAGIPRIEWVDLDGDGTRETPGILLEGGRTNAIIRSEELGNGVHSLFHATVNSDVITAPDGLVTADKLVEDGTNNAHAFLSQAAAITSGQITAPSVFLKGAERTKIRCGFYNAISTTGRWADVDLALGVINSNGTTGSPGALVQPWRLDAFPNGWYRLSVAFNVGAGETTSFWNLHMNQSFGVDSYVGDGVSGLYIWGLDIEVGQNFVSSYLKTVASTVTRAVDSLTVPFAFGPQDTTVLARIARPVHADASGDIGLFPSIYELPPANPQVAGLFGQVSRVFDVKQTTSAGAGNDNNLAIPAGAQLTLCGQFTGYPSAAKNRCDVGGGFGSYSTTLNFGTAYGNQTLRIGNGLYGVLLDLVIAKGPFTLAEISAVP